MRRPGWLLTTAGVLASLLGHGCTPSPVVPLDSDALLTAISRRGLMPEITCEALAEEFGVGYLEPVETPAAAGLPFEAAQIFDTGGARLELWYVPTALDRGTIVLSCGNAGNKACYLYYVQMLARNGWSVVVYDYQGFGGSGGERSFARLPENLDAVLDWTLARTQLPQVTLAGVSLGCIPAVAVAVARPSEVNGLILDSPVELREQLERSAFLLGFRPRQYLELLDPRLSLERMLPRAAVPLILLAGTRDALTSNETFERLFARAPAHKQFIVFDGLLHARALYQETGPYTRAVEAFLSEVWGQAPAVGGVGLPLVNAPAP